jgi:hypothetical protein
MVKFAVAALVGGLAFWAVEKYGMKDGKLFGSLAFEQETDGSPKLGLGYIATGAVIVLGAVGTGMLVHKLTGGKVPAGVGLVGK